MEIDEVDAPAVETTLSGDIKEVTMHPLVLLSAADHYHRVARGTRKRVVGVLLGSVSKGVVDCTNSFAVPFEEDSKNAVSLWKSLAVPCLVEATDCQHGSNCLVMINELTFCFVFYLRHRSLSFTWITITWKTCF